MKNVIKYLRIESASALTQKSEFAMEFVLSTLPIVALQVPHELPVIQIHMHRFVLKFKNEKQ